MDRLQGFGTNGYDYRRAAIERNNSSRLKWMMSEAKKSAEAREKDENKNNDSFSKIDGEELTNSNTLDNSSKPINNKPENHMFKPNEVNKFAKGNNFFKNN